MNFEIMTPAKTNFIQLPLDETSRPPLPTRPTQADRYRYVARGVAARLGGQLVYVERRDALYAQTVEGVFRRASEDQVQCWVRDQWLEDIGAFLPSNLSDTIGVLKTLTPVRLTEVDRRYFMMGPNTYWDMESGALVKDPKAPVYHKFFDTPRATKHIPRLTPFTHAQLEHTWQRYEETLTELERGEFPERYDFIKVWANNDHDVYMDMMRAFAYSLLAKKPVGAYILVGLRRNGKSTMIGLLHTIFGTNNTSKVQMAQLGDPHFTHPLLSTLLNAPDEEEETALNNQATFKTLCDHGILELPVMRSNEPLTLNCDFMSFFPMNHIPEFKGSGASACLERCLVIPFNNDLSKYDRVSTNFAEETFTPDVMADFMGTVFGIAHYYATRDFEFSKVMSQERQVLEEDQDSAVQYKERFQEYFDGFTSFKPVYDDYNLWCQTNEVKIKSLKEFKFAFREYRASRSSVRINGAAPIKCYRIPNGKIPYMDDYDIPEFGHSIKVMREDRRCSVVDQLDAYIARKKGEWNGR